MSNFKHINEIYNSLSLTDKSIKLLQNLSDNHDKYLDNYKTRDPIFMLLIYLLAKSDKRKHNKLALDFLKMPDFLNRFILLTYHRSAGKKKYPTIFETNCKEIHDYIISNLDLTKLEDSDVDNVVKILPEWYLKAPEIKNQAYKLDPQKCHAARKRLGINSEGEPFRDFTY